jgi:hypothetical protein
MRSLLQGLMRCSACGAPLVSDSESDHGEQRSPSVRRYGCQGGAGQSCGLTLCAAAEIEQLIAEAVLRRLEGKGLQEALAMARGDADDDTLVAYRDTERQLGDLLVDVAGAPAELHGERAALVAKRAAIAHHLRQRAAGWSPGVRLSDADLRELWNNAGLDWRRDLVATLIDHIDIEPGAVTSEGLDLAKVTITWKV